jgi:hypothetical protein
MFVTYSIIIKIISLSLPYYYFFYGICLTNFI